MRLVTVSTALALSIAALSLSTPASAQTATMQQLTKENAALVGPVKKASVQPAKKVAVAQPAKKAAVVQPVKKAAVAQPAKKAAVASTMKAAVAPAKTGQAVKRQHAAAVAPVKPVKKAAVTQRPRIASATPMAAATDTVVFDRHAVSGSAEFSQQMPQNVRGRRAEKTGLTQGSRAPRLFASPDPVSEARRWIGLNPTTRNTLWCATFMNFVLERSGYSGTGSDAASSFASYGHRIPGPRVGAIAVMTRGKNGGHVGIVSGFDSAGNPIIISGNHGKKVGEGVYPRRRIYAYVLPH